MKQRWRYAAIPLALMLAMPATAANTRPSGSSEARVLSGGVGSGERERLAEQARGYELKLVFTSNKGAYLADVPVTISDAKGHVVVDDVSQGPWMFVDLPPGAYSVKASYGGKADTRRITVGKSQKTVQFRWNEPDIFVTADNRRR